VKGSEKPREPNTTALNVKPATALGWGIRPGSYWVQSNPVRGLCPSKKFTQLFPNLTDDYFRRELAFLAHT
jgi:hypothetical protein